MEATDCAVKVFNDPLGGPGFTADYNCIPTESTVSATYEGIVPFTHQDYDDVTIYEVDVNVSNQLGGDDSNFTRLVTLVSGSTTTYTSVTTNGFCELDGKTSCVEGDVDCHPCPVVKNHELQTLSGTVTNVLNNEELLTSIAIMSDSDDDTSSAEKVINFKEDICGDIYNDDGTVNDAALDASDCEDPDNPGEVLISQDALLEYMAKDEE
jgi:hypothetical protein